MHLFVFRMLKWDVVVILFILTFTCANSHHDVENFYSKLISKFSSNGQLDRQQFKELALDITANQLESVYPLACGQSQDGKDCQNFTKTCLGYDDIFEIYSHEGQLNDDGLEDALPALLYFTKDANCSITVQRTQKHQKPSSAEAWGYGIGSVCIIVFISNVGAFLGPCMKTQIFKRILMFCVALAVGTLAGTGLLVLIPESMGLTGEDSPVKDYNWKMAMALAGIYFVFVSERLLQICLKKESDEEKEGTTSMIDISDKTEMDHGHGHSHFGKNETDKPKQGVASVAWILLSGDALHNFVDGMAIGAGFTENVFTGISVTLAVICEELPHELGDIAILLHTGMSIRRALLYNFLAAITCFGGLIIGIVVGENTDANRWIFAFAGGLFVYISLVAMIPEMNEQAVSSTKSKKESALQVFLYQNAGLIIGFCIILSISHYGKYIAV